jgi:hypothetical protein
MLTFALLPPKPLFQMDGNPPPPRYSQFINILFDGVDNRAIFTKTAITRACGTPPTHP